MVSIKEGGNQARLWSVVENRSEIDNNGIIRTFDVAESEHTQTYATDLSSSGDPRAPGV